jgi:WD40 repeat protein
MLQLVGHDGTVHALTFSHDGQTLFSAGKDGTVRLWDVVSRRERAQLCAHVGDVYSMSLHGDGRVLASGGRDCAVYLWNVATAERIGLLPKQISSVTGLAWLPQRPVMAVTCGERMLPDRPGELMLWQMDAKNHEAKSLLLNGHGYWSLAAGAGPTIAFSDGARRVSVWPLAKQQPATFQLNHTCLRVALAWDGSELAAAVEREIRVWDVNRRHPIATLQGHKGLVTALAYSPNCRILASGGRDKTVCFWSKGSNLELLQSFQWPTGAVTALAFSSDGLMAAAAGDNGTIVLWDVD